MILTLVSFFVVLAVLVLAHEMGHFFTAKAFKVRVEEFGLGFPPRLLSIKRGETRYSINALPLGGFVKMAGEEDPNVPGSLASKKAGVRVFVLAAGALMNLLLPIVLFSAAFMVPHNLAVGEALVDKVVTGSPADLSGMRAGDIILEINGKPIRNAADVHRNIQLNLGSSTTMVVRHSDSKVDKLLVTPRWKPPPGQGAVGIAIRTANPQIISEHYPLWQAVPMGILESIETFVLFKNEIISMIIGTSPVAVAGPVGIAEITGEAARAGLSRLLEFAAFLSINLAIVNILPLPALDGGRIAFVAIEWLRRGKRVPPKIEGLVHLLGFAMLMALILAVTYQDILRIISGEGVIP